MIEGTTTEETSTDLSLDESNLNRTSSISEDDVKEETVSEDPIVPVLKQDTPKNLQENVEETFIKNNVTKAIDSSETGRPEYKTKKEIQREEKLLRQQEERRIAQEVREGRERYDRRSQDKLDDITNRPVEPNHLGIKKTNKKESTENNLADFKSFNKKEMGDNLVLDEKLKPDVIQMSPAVKSPPKQEVFKKTQRSTSEATGTMVNSNLNRQESEDEPVILRSKPEPEIPEIGSAIERKKPLTKEDIQKMNLKKKTRKRTRKFEIDGVTVTTTTSKVVLQQRSSKILEERSVKRLM